MKKRKSFLKRVSLCLFSATLLCNIGILGMNVKQVHARPACRCPAPDMEVIYQAHGYVRYRCTNCGWWYDDKR